MSSKGWGRRVLVGCGAVVLGLVALELGLRVFWIKQLTLGAGIAHPHFHHRLAPSQTYHFASSEFDVTLRTNRYGLRGPEPVMPKPPGIFRLLMLGDSFAFGYSVADEETFSSLTKRWLQAADSPIEVINGGVSGYSPMLHYISLRDQFLAFEPDVVILWYDLGDLMEDHAFQKNVLYDDSGRIIRADPLYTHGRFDVLEWAQRHSALARYVNTKLLRTVQKIRILGLGEYLKTKLRGERSKVAIARLKRARRTPDLAESDKFLLVREDSTQELIEPYWALSAKYLVMIRDLLKERGSRFALGIYPYGMLVGPDEWAEGRLAWGFEQGRTYPAETYLTLMERFAETEGIPLINTFESFRQADQQEQLFYNWDGHFTPAGHRLLATHLRRDRRFLKLLSSVQK